MNHQDHQDVEDLYNLAGDRIAYLEGRMRIQEVHLMDMANLCTELRVSKTQLENIKYTYDLGDEDLLARLLEGIVL